MIHHLLKTLTLAFLIGGIMAGCAGNTAPPATATPVIISKFLATAYVSPTPNSEQIAATRAAQSPTPVPVLPSATPTPTPYVGVFMGRASREEGFAVIDAPFFEDEVSAQPAGTAVVDSADCQTPLEPDYERIWQENRRVSENLGCPIQEGFGFFGEVVFFQNGAIYYNPETRELWALLTEEYRFQEAPESVSTAGIQPPAGFFVPSGDFGSMWAGVEGLQDTLGFAQNSEPQRVALNIQRMESGSFLLDATSGQVFALDVDGTLFGPFEALPVEDLLPLLPTPLTIEPVLPVTPGP